MARWHSCNVLQSAGSGRNLWQFSTGAGGKVTLQRQEARVGSEPLPQKLVTKDWQTLFQPKLNVAWIPAEHVFLRGVQLPKADLPETLSTVHLQLEQLSQMTWAGELEGWLTSPPRYHLVANGLLAEDWKNLFPPALPAQIVPPVEPAELAALTARRVQNNGVMTNLLPPEYTTRYRQ